MLKTIVQFWLRLTEDLLLIVRSLTLILYLEPISAVLHSLEIKFFVFSVCQRFALARVFRRQSRYHHPHPCLFQERLALFYFRVSAFSREFII